MITLDGYINHCLGAVSDARSTQGCPGSLLPLGRSGCALGGVGEDKRISPSTSFCLPKATDDN